MAKSLKSVKNVRTFSEVATVQKPQTRMLLKAAPSVPKDLGPFKNLIGVWKGTGKGWNMIALPFQKSPAPPLGFKYRLLMNQYDEELQFTFIDNNVPNRGLSRPAEPEFDQFVVTLDYQQKISQVKAEDRPNSGLAGPSGAPIHHEPGLWLYQKNRCTKDDAFDPKGAKMESLDIARLSCVPHGSAVMAMGNSATHKGMPDIPPLSGMPSGRFEDLASPSYDYKSDPYLKPFKHYINNPFKGNISTPGFPGFSPADMNAILRFENKGVKILRTTSLTVDTERNNGGVRNMPFVDREADAVSMKSTFWIQELVEKDKHGKHKLRLQYSQIVNLHFFAPREDGSPGRAVWPHVSINTLEKEL